MKFTSAHWGFTAGLLAVGQSLWHLNKELTLPALVLSSAAPNQGVHVLDLLAGLNLLAGLSAVLSLALGAVAVVLGRGRFIFWALALASLATSLCLKPVGDASFDRAMASKHLRAN